jgi:hypothetical protein
MFGVCLWQRTLVADPLGYNLPTDVTEQPHKILNCLKVQAP